MDQISLAIASQPLFMGSLIGLGRFGTLRSTWRHTESPMQLGARTNAINMLNVLELLFTCRPRIVISGASVILTTCRGLNLGYPTNARRATIYVLGRPRVGYANGNEFV